MRRVIRVLGFGWLIIAALMVAYGLFGLSHFASYTGEYVDERLVLFDNGFYPFLWGGVMLVVAQILRVQQQRYIMTIAAVAGLLVLGWKRATIPAPRPPQLIFPDAELLTWLIVVCLILLCLACVDHIIWFRKSCPGKIKKKC